jgi:hypothetical protein
MRDLTKLFWNCLDAPQTGDMLDETLERIVANAADDGSAAAVIEHLFLTGAPPDPECSRRGASLLKAGSWQMRLIRAFLHWYGGRRGRFFVDMAAVLRQRPLIYLGFERRLTNILPLLVPPYLRNALRAGATDDDREVARQFMIRLGIPGLAESVSNDPTVAKAESKRLVALFTKDGQPLGLELPGTSQPRQLTYILMGLDLTAQVLLGADERLKPYADGLIMWVGGPGRMRPGRPDWTINILSGLAAEDRTRGDRRIFLDISWEGVAWERKDDPLGLLRQFTSELKRIGIDPRKVVVLHSNNRLCVGPGDDRILDEIDGMRLVGRPFTMALASAAYRQQRSQAGGADQRLHAAAAALSARDPERRHFLCFNHISKPHRIMVASRLGEIGAIPKTLLSFSPLGVSSHRVRRDEGWGPSLEVSRESAVASALLSIQTEGISPSLLSDAESAIGALHDRLPMTVDLDVSKHAGRGKPLGLGNEMLEPYLRSYMSIVTETYFSRGEWLFITEKICKAMYGLHPFLVAGDPGSLALLRQYGFQTFSPFIDESYDELVDPTDRMRAILSEIERLAALSNDEMHDLAVAAWPRVEHNYFRLMNDMPKLCSTFLQEAIA